MRVLEVTSCRHPPGGKVAVPKMVNLHNEDTRRVAAALSLDIDFTGGHGVTPQPQAMTCASKYASRVKLETSAQMSIAERILLLSND